MLEQRTVTHFAGVGSGKGAGFCSSTGADPTSSLCEPSSAALADPALAPARLTTMLSTVGTQDHIGPYPNGRVAQV